MKLLKELTSGLLKVAHKLRLKGLSINCIIYTVKIIKKSVYRYNFIKLKAVNMCVYENDLIRYLFSH